MKVLRVCLREVRENKQRRMLSNSNFTVKEQIGNDCLPLEVSFNIHSLFHAVGCLGNNFGKRTQSSGLMCLWQYWFRLEFIYCTFFSQHEKALNSSFWVGLKMIIDKTQRPLLECWSNVAENWKSQWEVWGLSGDVVEVRIFMGSHQAGTSDHPIPTPCLF